MQIKSFLCGIMHSNCYCLESDGEAVVIDPGYMSEPLLEYLNSEVAVKYIILTHNHFDHIGAVEEVKRITGAPIAISKEDEIGLYDDNYRLSASVHGRYGFANPDLRADVYLSDGDALTFGNEELKVIATPGHTPGGICLLVGNYLFSGDTLFASSIGRTDFIGGSFEKISKSLQKLMSLPDDTVVFAGHGPETTIGREKKTNPYLKF